MTHDIGISGPSKSGDLPVVEFPSFAVVVPMFNERASAGRCVMEIARALARLPNRTAVIVIDDGSTDGTREMLQEIYPSVNYLYQSNQGPVAARNRGIEASRGEWIAFLDSDDEWLPGKLQAQLNFFAAHPEYPICQTEEIWIRNGTRVNPMKKHKKY